jgi:ABC-type hemin transport system substrate-binding protein
LVSIEEELKSKAQHIADKISQALTEIGEKPYNRVDEVQAIFIVVMREKGGSCTLIGKTSHADIMFNVLAALESCKIISQDFGKAVLHAWMKAHGPPKK